MFEPTIKQLAQVMAHAGASDPLECCGVIADGEYFALKNSATDYDTFVMDMKGYCRVEADHTVEAIVHSHVYLPPDASDGDKAMCEKLGLPWLIVSWPTGKWRVIEPSGFRAPLIGRKWSWGAHDCYGIIRDGLYAETGIDIPDFPRDWLWWKAGGNIIAEHFEDAGFVRLPPNQQPQHCDVFAMRVGAPVVNHLGLFLAPDMLLHQFMGRISTREVYGGFYQDATEFHLRHGALLDHAPEPSGALTA